MGNPFFVALAKGAEFEAKKTNPNVKVTAVGFDYDLGKQNTQIDNFIAAGVDLILLNPGDANAIEPAIKRAQAAGIVVVAVDTAAKGANATVETNNTQAGTDRLRLPDREDGRQGQHDHRERPAGVIGDRAGERLQGGHRQASRRSSCCRPTRMPRDRATAALR